MTLLEVDHVRKVYAGGVVALDDVSLHVDAGEGVAIVGPSGSGKSTLLHLMGTLDRPSSGHVRIEGVEVGTLSDAAVSRLRGERLGFVFQQAHLADQLTALENVTTGLVYAPVPRGERRARAQEALERVGLADRANHRPGELSGGERQRVGIARALASRPTIVLADEPTGALDQATGRDVLALFDEIRQGGTAVVLITHDPGVSAAFSRRIEIRDGSVTE